ncbi:hypothetical protein C2845_PM09G14680 [Panicum miliaceum]|uniref:Uncharacterized protein n=1 Tax=Panicum miliaceum TaxID=4540 RepID=A0A3L6RX49_PANMI|nr:hypothetical protein C2845_PM09G14680 [Panicum miliaceum]
MGRATRRSPPPYGRWEEGPGVGVPGEQVLLRCCAVPPPGRHANCRLCRGTRLEAALRLGGLACHRSGSSMPLVSRAVCEEKKTKYWTSNLLKI